MISSNTEYTNETLIKVPKNFLKKTLIKNEAIERANKELLELYDIALNKKTKYIEIEKPRIIEIVKPQIIEKIKYIIKKPDNIKFKKLDNKKNDQNIKQNLLNKILSNSINNKKRILLEYYNKMNNNYENSELKIKAYDTIYNINNF